MNAKQENITEFMSRRMTDLGLTYKDVFDAGIGSQTFQNIRRGVPVKIKDVTKHKLATLLQCSIGDINAALAVTTQHTPFGEEITKVKVKPSVMETVDRLEEMVKDEHPENAEPEQEGKAEMKWYPDVLKEAPEKAPEKVPVKKEAFASEESDQEGTPFIESGAEPADYEDTIFPPEEEPEPEETLAQFKARMKDVCLRKFVENKDGDEAKISIAETLLKELLK